MFHMYIITNIGSIILSKAFNLFVNSVDFFLKHIHWYNRKYCTSNEHTLKYLINNFKLLTLYLKKTAKNLTL